MRTTRDQSTMVPSIVHAIRVQILAGRLREGEVIHQTDLAKELGVSPVPVREALRSLEVEGIVTFLPFRGTIVSPVTPSEISECYLIANALGAVMLPICVPKLTESDLKALHTHAERLDHGEATLDDFLGFYTVLLKPAEMPLMLDIVRNVGFRSIRIFALADANRKALNATRPTRKDIIEAAASRDIARTLAAFTEFHDVRRRGLLKALAERN